MKINKNKTGLKTLNKIAEHEAVEVIEKDEDGIWLYLNDGWNWDNCHTIHEYTVKDVMKEFEYIYKVEEINN